MIDYIDRDSLAASQYSFQIGDELVMVDNQTTAEIMTNLSRFFSDANPVSTSRDAAGYVPFRAQSIDPRAEELGATATVVIRRQAGNLETYLAPWVKSGTPLTKISLSPNPQIARGPGWRRWTSFVPKRQLIGNLWCICSLAGCR